MGLVESANYNGEIRPEGGSNGEEFGYLQGWLDWTMPKFATQSHATYLMSWVIVDRMVIFFIVQACLDEVYHALWVLQLTRELIIIVRRIILPTT